MATESNKTDRPDDGPPRYFVVELKSGAGPLFAVCERIAVFSPERDGIPAELVERHIGAHPLRAAALPTDDDGGRTSGLAGLLGTVMAYSGQTGRAPVSVVVTVNQNSPPSD